MHSVCLLSSVYACSYSVSSAMETKNQSFLVHRLENIHKHFYFLGRKYIEKMVILKVAGFQVLK